MNARYAYHEFINKTYISDPLAASYGKHRPK